MTLDVMRPRKGMGGPSCTLNPGLAQVLQRPLGTMDRQIWQDIGV
jgi:hypothetical protein